CVLALGTGANRGVTTGPGLGRPPVGHAAPPTAPSGVAATWNSSLAPAASHVTPDSDGHVDLTPYDSAAQIPSTDIPRRDLPFGTPNWQGTSGVTRSARGSGSAVATKITRIAPPTPTLQAASPLLRSLISRRPRHPGREPTHM